VSRASAFHAPLSASAIIARSARSSTGGKDLTEAQAGKTGTTQTEITTCDANADCLALFDCLMGCEDEACGTTCQETYPGGVNDLGAYLDCEDLHCANECK